MAYDAFFSLAEAISHAPPRFREDQRKASVAAVFRIVPLTRNVSLKGVDRGNVREVKAAFDREIQEEQVEVQVLFIKRSENPRDRHSGQVALPGGKMEANETPLQAAVRETK